MTLVGSIFDFALSSTDLVVMAIYVAALWLLGLRPAHLAQPRASL